MQKTKIEYADMVWNPVSGCLHNCPYCYARRIAARFDGYTDEAGQIVKSADEKQLHVLEAPLSITDRRGKSRKAAFPFGFAPTFHRYRLGEPARIQKPQTIFVGSMCDLFGEWVPDEWIQAVFEACEDAPWHRYLFITKNPARYGKLYAAGNLPKVKNFWYGTPITKNTDRRFPGALRLNTFLSIEPLMEELDVGLGSFGYDKWLIIGAETGSRKGKVTPEKAWIKKIEDAAAITHIPVFMKDSLLPIMGEARMRREFPWKT